MEIKKDILLISEEDLILEYIDGDYKLSQKKGNTWHVMRLTETELHLIVDAFLDVQIENKTHLLEINERKR